MNIFINIYSKKKSLIKLFLLFIFSINFAYSNNLHFAGFAFIGNANQHTRYPVANEIFKENHYLLSSKVKEALENLNRNDLNIIYDLGSLQSGDATAFAFGLMDESIERIANKFGVTTYYKIFGQVLIFDYIDKKVLSNFPVLSRYEVVTEKMPSKEYDKRVFTSLYLDLNREASIFSQWVKMLEKVDLKKSKNSLFIGVQNITYDEGVKQQLPDRLLNKNIMKTRTAQKFEYNIAYQYGIPLIPYTPGVAIGGKGNIGLMTRFDDAITMELVLPKIDYAIDVVIRKFRKKKVENEFYENLMYAAFIKVDLVETYENSIIFSEKFYWVEDISFAKTLDYTILDEWQIYETVQANLINKTVKVLTTQNDTIISEITQKDPKELKKKLSKVKNIFEKFN